MHHYLPQQFRDYFEERGINIEEYVGEIGAEWHRIIHGKLVETGVDYGPYLRSVWEDYNGRWSIWIDANPDATKAQVLSKMQELAGKFNIPYPPVLKK